MEESKEESRNLRQIEAQRIISPELSFPWQLPDRIGIATPQGLKETSIGSISGEEMTHKTSEIVTYELKFDTEPGDELATIEFVLKGVSEKDYTVITSGWHTWSGKETRGKQVGISSVSGRTKGGRSNFVVEPGMGGITPKGEGTSYGWLNFRKNDGSENIAVGVIPSLDTIEDIKFKQVDEDMVVTLRKRLEGVTQSKKREIKVFMGRGNYADLTEKFAQELEKLVGEVKPMRDRKIWFTWAAYGKWITQKEVEGEIPVAKEVGVDTIIIDDGWQNLSGDWDIKPQKFPDMTGFMEKMKREGIRPGIWVAPFMVMPNSEFHREHPDWLMKDKKGRELTVSNPQMQPTGAALPLAQRAFGLDVSIPEAREFIQEKLVRLSKVGFDSFKLDFISIPFMGPLKYKDKTSVEYYRQFFLELREKIREQAHKDIELIGCGAPMMESIGLFEGIRVSPDSAWPNLERMQLPYLNKTLGSLLEKKPKIAEVFDKILRRIENTTYRDAAAVAFRRALIFGKAHGLILDGIHLNDPKIHIDPERKKRLSLALPALKKLGAISNLFVGDSLIRAGEGGRKEWGAFLDRFSRGEVGNITEPILKVESAVASSTSDGQV